MVISLKSLLTEGTDILFHSTYINRFIDIIKNDKFILTFADDVDAGQHMRPGKYFYLSTSREKYSAYSRGGQSIYNRVDKDVVIKLDGRKISQRYKVIPVNYWGDMATHSSGLARKESEDRIMSEKQKMDFSPYVLEIHIAVRKSVDPNIYLDIYDMGKARDIPIYFYSPDNHTKIFGLNTKHAEDLYSILGLKDDDLIAKDRIVDKELGYYKTKREISVDLTTKDIIILLKTYLLNVLPKGNPLIKHMSTLNKMAPDAKPLYSYYGQDVYTYRSAIGNLRRQKNKNSLKLLEILGEILRYEEKRVKKDPPTEDFKWDSRSPWTVIPKRLEVWTQKNR